MADSLTILIGVLSLFRADVLIVRSDVALRCGELQFSSGQPVRITTAMSCDAPANWTIEVPGRISRQFRGVLSILNNGGYLTPVLRMDLEAAVAAAVAAEMPRSAQYEAMKAMAVLARSYYRSSAQRHPGYDFCDTTHCQFHREVPEADDAAMRATAETHGIVTTYRGRPFAPLYSAACGGRTLRAEDVGMRSDPYPYQSVACARCKRHEAEWIRKLPATATARFRSTTSEQARLEIVRQFGWQALPGNNYEVSIDGDLVTFRGKGSGHGVGVCQRGAIALAESGSSFREILRHFLPGVLLE